MALNQVNVGTIGTKLAAGTQQANAGFQGDTYVSQAHGKWYNAAKAGRLFHAATLVAGVIVPVNTTTAGTFVIYNPLTSGINMELVSLSLGWKTATTAVVGTILLSMSTQTPTSTTPLVNVSHPIGTSNTSQGAVYSAATVVAMTQHLPLFTVTGTTSEAMDRMHYDFDGKIVIAPGGCAMLTSTPVQTGQSFAGVVWAEWPV